MRMRHLFVVPALFVLIASALPSRAAGTAGARGSTYLVLYDDALQTPVWWSGTNGRSAGLVGMQGDGNLVIYDAAVTPLWMTGTAANASARLVLQSDGNLVVYAADGRPVWDRFSNPTGFIP